MFEMSRLARRQLDGGLRAAMAEYGVLAALIVLISLGSVTVAGANVNAVFTSLVDWIAAAG
jgi:Flp pilus assembly pilin Flp